MKVKPCIASSFLFAASCSVVASELFSIEESPKEKAAFEYSMKRSNAAIEGLSAISTLMEYQAFVEGRCDGYLSLETKANGGDGKAEYELGDLYHNGYCVPKSDSSSFKWMSAAANSGYEDAYFDLGIYYLKGIGTPVNKKSAAHWLALATKIDKRAFAQLAFIYLHGEGVPQNFSKALEYAKSGAELGDPVAQLLAATFLSNESFGAPDITSAYRWALLAKSSDNPAVAKSAQEVMERVTPQLSPAQMRDAQNAASAWKPQSVEKTPDPTDISLPKVVSIPGANMSETQARAELDKLALPRDRLYFFKAIETNNLDITRLYVMAGANINALSPFYMELPIHHAARNGSKDVVEYLINQGADINASANADGDTPILMAMSGKHRDVVDSLLNRGARIDHPGIVYNAVRFNDPALLKRLKDAGLKMDLNYVGTPLSNAVAAASESDPQARFCLERSVEYLLNNGANPNAKDEFNTVLTAAIGAKNPAACVRLLLEHGANPNEASPTNQSPLFLATLYAKSDVVSLLLDHGANAEENFFLGPDQIPMVVENKDARDALMHGGSLLLFAVSEEHASIASLLRNHGADPGKTSNTGESPLSLATKKKDKVMQSLLKGAQ